MRRTRKWAYVAQEAKRLAKLRLSPTEIAKRLDVERRTIQRWMEARKLTDTRRSSRGNTTVGPVTSGGEWAASVRASYALDATDEQLVMMADVARGMAHDPLQSPQVRLSAQGRFQAIVKQLALSARDAVTVPEPAEQPKKPDPPTSRRRPGSDPRRILMAVK